MVVWEDLKFKVHQLIILEGGHVGLSVLKHLVGKHGSDAPYPATLSI